MLILSVTSNQVNTPRIRSPPHRTPLEIFIQEVHITRFFPREGCLDPSSSPSSKNVHGQKCTWPRSVFLFRSSIVLEMPILFVFFNRSKIIDLVSFQNYCSFYLSFVRFATEQLFCKIVRSRLFRKIVHSLKLFVQKKLSFFKSLV